MCKYRVNYLITIWVIPYGIYHPSLGYNYYMGIRLKFWNIPRKNKAIILPMSPLNAFPSQKLS